MLNSNARVRVAEVADRAWGRIHWSQLCDLGIARGTISLWAADGYLHEKLPGVYAVGHRSGSVEAEFAEALLYAGPGAMLSHQTGAWWWGLTDRKPQVIHVTTPRRCCSQPNVKVHGRRKLDRVWHKDLPVTPLPQTLLDCAAQSPLEDVRYFLAEADYHWRVRLDEVAEIAGRGRRGSARLREALAVHWPDLARTQSPPEREVLFLIEAAGLPRPQVNVRICGLKVDAYWPEYKVAVEIDGGQGHGTERQVARDHGRDLTLRSAGIVVRRYARHQVRWEGPRVLADLRAAGLP
jgi:very-short-patch-repair endonuclease